MIDPSGGEREGHPVAQASRGLLGRFATRTRPLGRDARRDWVIVHERADGVIEEVKLAGGRLSIIHPRLGRFTYGLAADGEWDQVSYAENAGGGAVLVPFAEIDGRLHVGLIAERRRYQASAGVAYGVPRGFVDDGETHWEAAVREGEEEAGLGAFGDRVFALDAEAEPMNTNSAFVETWGRRPGGEAEGTRFFACRLQGHELAPTPDGRLAVDVARMSDPSGDRRERLLGLRFEPIEVATRRGDAFTRAGCALLFVAAMEGRLSPLTSLIP